MNKTYHITTQFIYTTMEIEEPAPDTYLIDTEMNGHKHHTASYILTSASEVAVIETGLSTAKDRIMSGIRSIGREPEDVSKVIPTHLHLDHAGSAGRIMKECPNAELISHENAYDFYTNQDKADKLVESVHRAVGDLADRYGDFTTVDSERVSVVKDQEDIEIGNRVLTAHYRHGHAPHQICLHDHETNTLHPGDEAGMYLYGEITPTSPPPNFDLDKNLESLDYLKNLEPDTILYPHYGAHNDPERAIEDYRDTLKDWVDKVKETYEETGDEQETINKIQSHQTKAPNHWDPDWSREATRMDIEGVLLYLKRKQ